MVRSNTFRFYVTTLYVIIIIMPFDNRSTLIKKNRQFKAKFRNSPKRGYSILFQLNFMFKEKAI